MGIVGTIFLAGGGVYKGAHIALIITKNTKSERNI